MGVKVTTDLSGVKKKLSKQNFDRGAYAVANQAMADMNPFVPKQEGNLRLSAHIVKNTQIAYEMPYARAKFYNPSYRPSTPGTGPRWDLKAKGLYIKDWQRAFVKGSDLG